MFILLWTVLETGCRFATRAPDFPGDRRFIAFISAAENIGRYRRPINLDYVQCSHQRKAAGQDDII
ncbi:MAG: hypothetical protein DSZ01_00365 [Gammaproteobacteria bacterium]|nr:MAG: hypothetical protein DSZ02_07160 [Gammaproteobacteria bacterium]RTZ81692.1 MAG: hypothetical protein DSZ01_00365 [Gammaproteobacteria bacterium]